MFISEVLYEPSLSQVVFLRDQVCDTVIMYGGKQCLN